MGLRFIGAIVSYHWVRGSSAAVRCLSRDTANSTDLYGPIVWHDFRVNKLKLVSDLIPIDVDS